MSSVRDGLARSLQAKLSQHAKRIGADPNLVLTRYAVERYLYRLSRSGHAEKFVLKGALLMLACVGDTVRPTRDADMLGFGDVSPESLAKIFAEVCAVPVEPDAMIYLVDTLRLEPIRIDDDYGGHRATLMARMGAARLRVQVDVGVGDAVVPAPQWIEYPSLLDLPKPRLRAYTPATVIAERFHAITVLGMLNSRLKDYYDLYSLSQGCDTTPAAISKAIKATFQRRNTVVPGAWPIGLTSEFADNVAKAAAMGCIPREKPRRGSHARAVDRRDSTIAFRAARARADLLTGAPGAVDWGRRKDGPRWSHLKVASISVGTKANWCTFLQRQIEMATTS